jgi:hypothetical protein
VTADAQRFAMQSYFGRSHHIEAIGLVIAKYGSQHKHTKIFTQNKV